MYKDIMLMDSTGITEIVIFEPRYFKKNNPVEYKVFVAVVKA